jgi:hypothetical protein
MRRVDEGGCDGRGRFADACLHAGRRGSQHEGMASYQVFPAVDSGMPGPGRGKLSGRLRAKCGEYYFGLAGRTVAQGFAAVNTTGDAVLPVQLQQVAVKPAYTKAVAELIARVAKVKVAPTIEHAYSVDLDGNDKPEIILQATPSRSQRRSPGLQSGILLAHHRAARCRWRGARLYGISPGREGLGLFRGSRARFSG